MHAFDRDTVAGHSASRLWTILLAALLLAAFALYWATSFALEAGKATTRLGADVWFYSELAKGGVFERMSSDPLIERIFRFHPVTVILGVVWMKLVEPLSIWFTHVELLRAMFAAIGALGVWAAYLAFASFISRPLSLLWAAIYGLTLTVWFFSGIEESKILSATLAGFYIAVYLRLRSEWTLRGALLLTAIFLLACLNEIVAGLLVVIPAIDTLIRRGLQWNGLRWVFAHGLAAPLALLVLEWIARWRPGAAPLSADSSTLFGMFIWYVSNSEYSFAKFYAFLLRWVFFNIAAPQPFTINADPALAYGGDFDPVLSSYFHSPAGAAFAALGIAVAVLVFLPRYRPVLDSATRSILIALAAYSLLRAVFFFIFLHKEGLLYTSSVTLAHLLIAGIPFMASRIPGKPAVLAVGAVLLFVINGTFMLTPQ